MKLGAALLPLLFVSTATTALAQTAPAAGPPPAADAPVATAPVVAAQPVVVVSPGPVVVTQPAAAPAVVATPAAPAPAQNQDWNNVNHINGQVVKVGESDDYLKSYKRTNISTNPIGWIIGSYGVSVSYGINDHVAIRGDVGFLSNYLDENTTGFSVGVGAPLYLKRTYRGPFLEPGFALMTVKRSTDGYYSGCTDCRDSSATVAGPQMLFGWHWTWDSGFNLAVAAGVGRNWSTDSEYSQIFPNGYFRVGYAF